jgi:hypothetical protein
MDGPSTRGEFEFAWVKSHVSGSVMNRNMRILQIVRLTLMHTVIHLLMLLVLMLRTDVYANVFDFGLVLSSGLRCRQQFEKMKTTST